MAKSPAFQFYPKDWLSDDKVRMLSWEAKGVYIELLAVMWNTGRDTIEVENIPKVLGIHRRSFARILAELLRKNREVFELKGGKLTNKRLDDERRKQLSRKEKATTAAEKRWHPDDATGISQASPEQCIASASAVATAKQEEARCVTFDGLGFHVPPQVMDELMERWPVGRKAIELEITDCGQYHIDKGTDVKSPRGRITTWLKNAFDGKVTPGGWPEEREVTFEQVEEMLK